MTDQHTKGVITDVKGKVEETAGKVTGNDEQERHGQATQVQGEAQKTVGDVQDVARRPPMRCSIRRRTRSATSRTR